MRADRPERPELFDRMTAEGGDPLGAHRDMPAPRFDLEPPPEDRSTPALAGLDDLVAGPNPTEE